MNEVDYRKQHTASQLAALTLANAFIFQSELATQDSRVKPLRKLLQTSDPVKALADHWEYICDNINYVPIFHIARQILLDCPPRKEMHRALGKLGDTVLQIVAQRAALRHDLMGRIYHRLLLDAKYLGTYYTSVPAATLLLKLALRSQAWPLDWNDQDQIRELRIGDLACGTGTLLMAAQQAATDNYVRATTAAGGTVDTIDLRDLHQILIEDVLYGWDVLLSAVHLTASTLALLAPEIAFKKTNLTSLFLGETKSGQLSLGSVEFLRESGAAPPQLSLTDGEADGGNEEEGVPLKVSGVGAEEASGAVPDLDLCVMNPPFTRSVGGNLLFGSLPKEERAKLQDKLRKVLRPSGRPDALASTTAGLGSVFVAVGDRYVKQGGRMALVLPAAVTSGVAWEKTRRLFSQRYVPEFVITSHDPERWNFSENTSLSEALLIVRRREDKSEVEESRPVFVSLWENTETPVDALGVADAILGGTAADITRESGVSPLVLGGRKRGEMVQVPFSEIRDDQWYPAAFAQTDLIRAAHFVRQGKIFLPGKGVEREIPVVPLSSMAELGPDVRDVRDAFEYSDASTPYAAYLNHNSKKVRTLGQGPNRYLDPLSTPREGRPDRDANLIWSRAGRVLLAERLRLNTQRLVAVKLPEKVLSNVWWPLQFEERNEAAEKALVMWLNSSFGLLTFASCREATEGPWGKFKKPVLRAMPVMDPAGLEEESRKDLATAYDSLQDDELQPFKELNSDPVRRLIDEAIGRSLGLPSVKPLRDMLAREPIVCGERLDQPVSLPEPQRAFVF